jgi:Tfp pilus assembly protein PilF
MTSSHDKTRQDTTLPVTTPAANDGRRLNSWKEVAAYFGRTDRTVMRWEVERGLPIHRVPGMPKSRIYADVLELEAWRRGAQELLGEDEGSEPNRTRAANAPLSRQHRFTNRQLLFGFGVVALALIILAIIQLWRVGARVPLLPQPPPPLAAQRLYIQGMDDWEQRTPASLNRAVGEFRQAIAIHPGYAEAYAGLAESYDLLREYTLMPATQAYSLAKTAAEHALALNDQVAAAHAALAFADYFGFWDTADARKHFQRAIDIEPNNETARHWCASFLSAEGDDAGALRQIDRAIALNPTSLAIRADRDLFLIRTGQVAPGVADLQRLAHDHPAFLSPYSYLADYALTTGDNEAFLKYAGIAARLTSNTARLAVLKAARQGFDKGGRAGLLKAMYDAQSRLFESGVGKAVDLAHTAGLMGDKALALADLSLAIDRHETELQGFDHDPAYRMFASDPDFRRIVEKLKSPG